MLRSSWSQSLGVRFLHRCFSLIRRLLRQLHLHLMDTISLILCSHCGAGCQRSGAEMVNDFLKIAEFSAYCSAEGFEGYVAGVDT